MTDAADRRARRREELLDAAGRVIAAQGPDASMTAIAGEAGITKPILYRHFGDKEGLFRALAERHAAPLADALRRIVTGPGTRRERTRRAVEAYLDVVESSPEVYRALLHHAAVEEEPHVQPAVSAATRVVAEAVSAALVEEADLDPDVASVWGHGVTGLVQVAGDWWLEHRAMPRSDLVETLTVLLWDGLAGLPGGGGEDDAAALD